MKTVANTEERTFTIERTFDAPRTLVWQAWSDCEHLRHWWAPAGWKLPVCKIDFRVGGTWHYCMRGPGPSGEEMESWGYTVYHEIVEPERIVSVDAFADEAGNISEEMPKLNVTVTFHEVDGKTQVLSRTEFATAAELETVVQMGMEEGVTQSWDQLDAHLSRLQQ